MLVVLSAGCMRTVTEAEMQDQAKRQSIAREAVKTEKKQGGRVKRVAVVGVMTVNSTKQSRSGWSDPLGIQRTTEAVNTIRDMAKSTACQALDTVFDAFPKALTDTGIEVVSAEDKLQSDKYKMLGEKGMGLMCFARRAPAFIGMGKVFGGNVQEAFGLLNQLMEELNVDGILLATVIADDLKAGDATLTLFNRTPGGIPLVGWMGKIKKGKIQFERAASGNTDDARVANAGRVYAHEFELLAAKLGLDSVQP